MSDGGSDSDGEAVSAFDGGPVVYRSFRLRIIIIVSALALVLLSLVFWFALPANLRAEFSLSQVVTLAILLAGFVLALFVVGSGVVRADAETLSFRNGLIRRSYPWSQVYRVVLAPGDNWAHVLLVPTDRELETEADLERRMLMGIQTLDGVYADAAVAELNSRIHRH